MTLNLLCFYCYIIFSASGCQVNSDPAPGRSPGPPNVDFNQAYNNINLEQTIQVNNGTFESNENANNSELSNKQQNEEKLIKSSNKLKTFINHINNSKFNNQKKNSENLRSESDKYKHCKSVSTYVDDEEKIVKLGRGNDEKNSVPIKFDVIHDLFDTQRGLINGLIYTGESLHIFNFFVLFRPIHIFGSHFVLLVDEKILFNFLFEKT